MGRLARRGACTQQVWDGTHMVGVQLPHHSSTLPCPALTWGAWCGRGSGMTPSAPAQSQAGMAVKLLRQKMRAQTARCLLGSRSAHAACEQLLVPRLQPIPPCLPSSRPAHPPRIPWARRAAA